jgi:predicted DCC family thiol-disulfide oxidoreductase YuxK
VRFIERHDTNDRIEAMPLQRADLGRFGVSRQAAEEAMQLVSPAGEVRSGAAAARRVLELLPKFKPLAWLFYLPGAMFVAERLYRWVARRRHRFGCDSAVCRRGGDG